MRKMTHRSLVTRRPRKPWAVALVSALALSAAACGDTLLDVETPDIIDPSDVQSPAGANAVRVGTLARFAAATSGTVGGSNESLFSIGGLLADEWVNGDTFQDRHDIDRRDILSQNAYINAANRAIHRVRLSAEQTIHLLATYSVNAPPWQTGEMHFIQAFSVNLLAENFCNGLVLSTVDASGAEVYGSPMTNEAAYQRALQHADDGLPLVTGSSANDLRVRHALQVVRGRILMNLNRPADALAAVAGVPTNFQYLNSHSVNTSSNGAWLWNNSAWRYSVADNEGGNGLNFASAGDPRVPVCRGGDAACRAAGVTRATRNDNTPEPFHVQLVWPTRDSPMAIVSGIDARMIEAEAQLRANNPVGSLATLNATRATVTGLVPLTDAGSEAARVDQLFRERGFWGFGRGQRVGDLRRLIRQYGRAENTVFPIGGWHKAGGAYSNEVNFPIPASESNNPNVPPPSDDAQIGYCMDRNA